MKFFPLVASSAILVIPQVALSAPPDAGVLQQQFQRDSIELPQVEPEILPEPATALPAVGETMVVAAFEFVGNTVFNTEELLALVASYQSKPITFNDLLNAVASVGEFYRNAGWVARVYVPEQEVKNGVVRLQVVEGRYGKWSLDGEAPSSFNTDRVDGYLTNAQASGELLNSDRMDRALLLLDDLPGISVVGNLTTGENTSQTDLLLQVGDEAQTEGQLSLDNFGSRSTGVARLNGEVYFKSPTNIGDQVKANLTHSEGNDFVSLAYTRPLGYDGWRVGVNGSYLKYDVILDEFAAADLDGKSSTLGLEANYPIIRQRNQNLYLGISYDAKKYENRSQKSVTSDYSVDSATLSLNGNLFDRIGGGGANSMTLAVTSGDVDLGSIDTSEDVAIEGKYTKLTYALSRQQVITNDLSLFANVSGQFADGNLDSSEQYYLGGPSAVRAYPVSEAGGDEGIVANLELRYRLQSDLVLTGFYDWGEILQNKDNAASQVDPNRYQLKGAGVSLAWTAPYGIKVNATLARRVGKNPNPTSDGNDQDGSLDMNRFWLNVAVPF